MEIIRFFVQLTPWCYSNNQEQSVKPFPEIRPPPKKKRISVESLNETIRNWHSSKKQQTRKSGARRKMSYGHEVGALSTFLPLELKAHKLARFERGKSIHSPHGPTGGLVHGTWLYMNTRHPLIHSKPNRPVGPTDHRTDWPTNGYYNRESERAEIYTAINTSFRHLWPMESLRRGQKRQKRRLRGQHDTPRLLADQKG